MSQLFFDHILDLSEVEKEINSLKVSKEERDELWQLVDEVVHHKILGCILDELPREHHEEFLFRFKEKPHDKNLLPYLEQRIGKNVEELIKQEMGELAYELLSDIKKKE